jgi:hypothetical protein
MGHATRHEDPVRNPGGTRLRLERGTLLIEEQSEGGDILARRVHEDAGFTSGMARVCAGGGVALYRKQ